MARDGRKRSWWGAHALAEESAARVRVGPLSVYAHRRRHEWRIAFGQDADPLAKVVEVEVPFSAADIPALDDAVRFGFGRSPDVVRVMPALADRNVVLTPERTLHIAPGEGVDVFVSTPLWLRLSFEREEDAATRPRGSFEFQHEVPIHRPSDTWFGPNTLVGELCYASRTHAYLSLDEVQRYPQRARTIVHVKNRGEDRLVLERLNVPVRHLSLFASEDDSLWTERVTLTREADGGLAAMRVGAGPPPETVGAVKLADARVRVETNVVVRAFEAFFKESET